MRILKQCLLNSCGLRFTVIIGLFCIVATLFIQGVQTDSTALTILNNPNEFRDRQELQNEVLDFSGIWKDLNFDFETECHLEVDIEWEAFITSASFGSPIIGDFRNDGQKEIIVATLNEYVEALDGEDGEKEPGWPFILPGGRFLASPVDYDLQGDGARDLIIATDHAEIIFINEVGLPYIGMTLKVPGLEVDKNWYENIESKYVYFALYTRLPSLQERIKEEEDQRREYETRLRQYQIQNSEPVAFGASIPSPLPGNAVINDRLIADRFKYFYQSNFQSHLLQQRQNQNTMEGLKMKHVTMGTGGGEAVFTSQNDQRIRIEQQNGRKLMGIILDDDEDDLEDERGERELVDQPLQAFNGIQGWLTNDGVESLDLFFPSETSSSFITQLRYQVDPRYSPQYDIYKAIHTRKEGGGDKLIIDPHFFTSPIIADLNNDGKNELIVAVNYFFSPTSRIFKDSSIQLNKYMATAIVVFDLIIHDIKWISPLDLSTETQRLRATFSSPPTIIDIDGDKYPDILCATGIGHIYALNRYGVLLEGFPITMNSIFAPIIVEDIDDDGKLDIIAIDSTSTVAVFNTKGELKWEKLISRGVTSAPAIGDVDGDGDLDIVIFTPEGHLWVLDGKTGHNTRHFPGRFSRGNSVAPTLFRLSPEDRHLHIVIHSSEGHIYVINGRTACVETIDVGQRGSSTILLDDVTGDGELDLVATGINRVTCLSITSPFHPMNIKRSALNSRGGVNAVWRQGVYFTNEMREMRDIAGDHFIANFEIFDSRPPPPSSAPPRYYRIRISLRRDMEPFYIAEFNVAGQYSIVLPSPSLRFSGSLRIEMVNELGQYFEDHISLSFNAKFYRSIKWVVMMPFFVAGFVVLFFHEIRSAVSLV